MLTRRVFGFPRIASTTTRYWFEQPHREQDPEQKIVTYDNSVVHTTLCSSKMITRNTAPSTITSSISRVNPITQPQKPSRFHVRSRCRRAILLHIYLKQLTNCHQRVSFILGGKRGYPGPKGRAVVETSEIGPFTQRWTQKLPKWSRFWTHW